MFLWVDLMFSELKDIKDPKVLRLRLETMPTGLPTLYKTILTRVENENGEGKTVAQLKEIFCWVAYSKEPLSVLDLNQIIRFATDVESFDTEKTVNICASLFQVAKTRNVLFKTLVEPLGGPLNSGSIEGEFDESDDQKENCESEEELDEDEVCELEEERQGEIFIHLRHASVGDYIEDSGRKPMGVLFNANEAPLHMLLTNLRIVCEGSSVPERLWHHAMDSWLSQLHDLDEKTVLEADIRLIVEHLATIFNSEALGKYIAQEKCLSSWNSYYSSKFDFGSNTDLQNRNRATIRKWLQRAVDLKSISLAPDVDEWIKELIKHPLKLLVPLSKTCITEWLACDGSSKELSARFGFAWFCATSVRTFSYIVHGRSCLPVVIVAHI
jgi:hypothetical protein